MKLSRINYLRNELNNECIDTAEISEIVAAFEEIPVAELRDLPENAMASDMLDELESRISIVERTIWNWVLQNFGESEADDPSWDISLLAEEINNIPVHFGAEETTLNRLLNGE